MYTVKREETQIGTGIIVSLTRAWAGPNTTYGNHRGKKKTETEEVQEINRRQGVTVRVSCKD